MSTNSHLFETECSAKPVSGGPEKRGGKRKVRFEFEILDGDHKGKRVGWDGKLEGDAIKWTKRDLLTLGWQGKASATIADDVLKAPRTVRIKTRIARYTRDDGSVSEWTSVDRIFGAPKPGEALDKRELEEMDQWFAEVPGEANGTAPPPADTDLPF